VAATRRPRGGKRELHDPTMAKLYFPGREAEDTAVQKFVVEDLRDEQAGPQRPPWPVPVPSRCVRGAARRDRQCLTGAGERIGRRLTDGGTLPALLTVRRCEHERRQELEARVRPRGFRADDQRRCRGGTPARVAARGGRGRGSWSGASSMEEHRWESMISRCTGVCGRYGHGRREGRPRWGALCGG